MLDLIYDILLRVDGVRLCQVIPGGARWFQVVLCGAIKLLLVWCEDCIVTSKDLLFVPNLKQCISLLVALAKEFIFVATIMTVSNIENI